jgi:hypothetical protein
MARSILRICFSSRLIYMPPYFRRSSAVPSTVYAATRAGLRSRAICTAYVLGDNSVSLFIALRESQIIPGAHGNALSLICSSDLSLFARHVRWARSRMSAVVYGQIPPRGLPSSACTKSRATLPVHLHVLLAKSIQCFRFHGTMELPHFWRLHTGQGPT